MNESLNLDEIIIRCVERNEVLYNRKHLFYSKGRKKADAWKEIAKECNQARKLFFLSIVFHTKMVSQLF